jgi:type II secretion system protein N
VKARLLRIAKALAFPAFYLSCLGLFGYLSFPYGRLKDRVIAEFEKRGKPGQRLEIGKLSAYWFTGVELSNVKLHLPPDEPSSSMPGVGEFGMPAPATPAKESVIVIDEAHARVRILPLLIGRVRLDFWASAFGGEIKGSAPVGSSKGDVEVEVSGVDISKIEPVAHAVGVPIKGSATGKLTLSAPEGKFNKANGTFDLTISDVVVSDGKTKIQGMIELPPAKLGDLTLSAEAKDGILKVTKLSGNGSDLELVGDGKVSLKEPWNEAVADLYLRFKFTDAYRGKSATTKSLLGDAGSSSGGLMETAVPKMKRAKRPDGFYGWHIYGPLKRLKFDPSTADGGGTTAATAAGRPRPGKAGTDSPFNAPKRPNALMPTGPSTATKSDDPVLVPAATAPDRARETPPEPEVPGRRGIPQVNLAPTPPPQPAPEPVAPAPTPEPAPQQQPALEQQQPEPAPAPQ